MGDSVKSLRKENDSLKKQLQELRSDFQTFKNKMADKTEVAIASLPNENDLQFLSQGYDSMTTDMQGLLRRLDILTKNIYKIDKAVDEMLFYSYQYNLKLVGVPHISENESSEDTANLCLKLFAALGVATSTADIDIAHRVPARNNTSGNGHRRHNRPDPIICKFTRRMARDQVLSARGNVSRITTDDLELSSTVAIDRIAIYSHLTPKLQELLHAAKEHSKSFSYKWCWAKGTAIYLRKTDSSRSLRLKSMADLAALRLREASTSPDTQANSNDAA